MSCNAKNLGIPWHGCPSPEVQGTNQGWGQWKNENLDLRWLWFFLEETPRRNTSTKSFSFRRIWLKSKCLLLLTENWITIALIKITYQRAPANEDNGEQGQSDFFKVWVDIINSFLAPFGIDQVASSQNIWNKVFRLRRRSWKVGCYLFKTHLLSDIGHFFGKHQIESK